MKPNTLEAKRKEIDITKAEKKMKIIINFIGPVAEHNLLCWLCEEKPAVYDMNPNFIFRPCWGCQEVFNLKQHKSKVKELANMIMQANKHFWEQFK